MDWAHKTIDEISQIRIKNNECWMEILKLSFQAEPEKAKQIFKKIIDNDGRINELSKKLGSY